MLGNSPEESNAIYLGNHNWYRCDWNPKLKRFMIVSRNGYFSLSEDGLVWVEPALISNGSNFGIVNDLCSIHSFFVVAGSGGRVGIYRNGSWEIQTVDTCDWVGVKNYNNNIVLISSTGKAAFSGRGLTWRVENIGVQNLKGLATLRIDYDYAYKESKVPLPS